MFYFDNSKVHWNDEIPGTVKKTGAKVNHNPSLLSSTKWLRENNCCNKNKIKD